MVEGVAIGFDATGAGTIVGTAMAGLVGATDRIVLPRTRIRLNLPTECLYHVNGEAFRCLSMSHDRIQMRIRLLAPHCSVDRDRTERALHQVIDCGLKALLVRELPAADPAVYAAVQAMAMDGDGVGLERCPDERLESEVAPYSGFYRRVCLNGESAEADVSDGQHPASIK